jgi:ribosomal protein S18 acetylase RimI-like enzyme
MVIPLGNYRIEAGSTLDRARLVKFMHRTYQELGTTEASEHLTETVDRHFSEQSQLWWLVPVQSLPVGLPGIQRTEPVGCLWQGEAVDQRSGLKQAYVFLLYVAPEHRHQGLGTALMQQAQTWAKQQGYSQIGLQVFESNAAALRLYDKLGYVSQAKWLSLEL